MKLLFQLSVLCFFVLSISSCAAKKKLAEMEALHETELANINGQLGKCGKDLNEYMGRLTDCENEKSNLKNTLDLRQEQINDLRGQVADFKEQRDKQMTQVGDLTVLSQSASNNVANTLQQLEGKDKYIKLLQAAKTKADSINLALAVNLKGVLKNGIEDEDVEIKVDKTVVFINLSDKMLFQSGSSNLTSRANEVLGKIAQIIKSRPELEVMVEGYTDSVPISNSCVTDNWDLSVKRSTSVIRILQKNYNIDPNRLIAAGRGEYNQLAPNDTAEGRSTNRRTRIIIMPKLNEFYDLLNPAMVPE